MLCISPPLAGLSAQNKSMVTSGSSVSVQIPLRVIVRSVAEARE